MGDIQMKSLIPNWLFRIVLAFGLLLTPSFNNSAAADPPGTGPAASSQSLAPDANILTIPTTGASISVDGFCDTTAEYANAQIKTFMDGNGKSGTVYLIANADMLYVCMYAQQGVLAARFGRVYLDPQGDGSNYVFANQGDDAFQVNITSPNRSSYIGNNNPNGWTTASELDGFWTGLSTISADGMETIEYGLQLGALGFGNNCNIFGLSVFHHWFQFSGDDYAWPASSIFDQPRTWQLARILTANCPTSDIAYVYRGNTEDSTSFYNLLTANGYGVDLISLASVLTTDFSAYKMIIIADDSGSLNQWGTPTFTDAQVAQIKLANKPILGLGEGGYAFFGRLSLFIGWPRGWHGPQNIMDIAPTAPAGFFNPPIPPVTHYVAPFNSVGIYLPPNQSLPGDVTPIGMESPPDDHSSLIAQGCRTLWGNSGNPLIFTADGKLLFLNTISVIHNSQCPTEPPPDLKCREVIKTASPAAGTPVVPGQVIVYTLTYTYSSDQTCNNNGEAKIIDSIPIDTTYVPGSASDGISPGADGGLTWSVVPGTGVRTKSFKITVSDTQCANQRMVNNQASLLAIGFAPVISNVVTHPVTCPPVGFPTREPSYAEDELQVHPYPLLAGLPSEVSVRLTNSGTAPNAVTVQFQVNPSGIGIGLPFTTFDTRSVTIPAASQIILKTTYLPAASGLACFQVTVTPTGYAPIRTQTCLDNIEDFSGSAPLLPDAGGLTLNFMVGNPTSSTANIQLVVVNTCPGWSAGITVPGGGILTNVLPDSTDLRNAALQVTPPIPATLGSGCFIDVQGWIINQPSGTAVMIGGIRKLDIPPVHLPTNINPPWEEPEISIIPNPPVAGLPGQLCIDLNNPLDVEKTVTVVFNVADFGAGIAFMPVGTQTLTLLPHTFSRYCIPWTPSSSGSLHRCIQVILQQAGYQDMHSQLNVDIVRTTPSGSGFTSLMTQVSIVNPDLVNHTLSFDMTTVGLDPYWAPRMVDSLGNPAATEILPGQTLTLYLRLMPETKSIPLHTGLNLVNYLSGDQHEVEVSVLLDGVPSGGFTTRFYPYQVYLPVTRK
jgi:uncharacterized repeat protein (TIGR01451 family)